MTSLDDITFEKLNKAYGAYAIRKAYNMHVFAGMGVATVLITSLLTWLSMISYAEKKEIIRNESKQTVPFPVLPPLVLKKVSKQKPPPVSTRKLNRKALTRLKKIPKSKLPSAAPKAPTLSSSKLLPALSTTTHTRKEGRPKTPPTKKARLKSLSELPPEAIPPYSPVSTENNIKALDRKISLHLKDVTLKYALRIIENQAAVKFIYSRNHIDMRGTVTVDADQKTLLEVLQDLLDPRKIQYRLEQDDFIVLFSKLKIIY